MLHAQQHGYQRLLQFLVELLELRKRSELRPQRVMQAQRDVGIFCCVFRRLVYGYLVEGELLGAFARDVLIGDCFDAQVTRRR